jgi:hypothetical protein
MRICGQTELVIESDAKVVTTTVDDKTKEAVRWSIVGLVVHAMDVLTCATGAW